MVSDGYIGGEPAGAARVDCSGCLIIPGLCCAHHHLYSALARGMPGPSRAPRDFLEILQLVWWPLDRALNLEDIELSALCGAVEAARSGTTTIVDHHASYSAIEGSLDAVAAGLQSAGTRAALCFEVSDRHGPAAAAAAVEENLRFNRSNNSRMLRAMMGAHASFTISPETMSSLTGAARDAGLSIHIHVSEDELDERDSIARYKLRTLQRLRAEGAVEEGDLIAHGVHLDEEELRFPARLRRVGRAQPALESEQCCRLCTGRRVRRASLSRHRRHRRGPFRRDTQLLPAGTQRRSPRCGGLRAGTPRELEPRSPVPCSQSRPWAPSSRVRPPISWCSTIPPQLPLTRRTWPATCCSG